MVVLLVPNLIIIASWIDDLKYAPITEVLPARMQIVRFFTEMIGTFLLTTMVQITI